MDDIAKIETQLGRAMVIIAGLAAAAILPLAGARAFLGFAIGATLALVGYRWLARAVAAALDERNPAPWRVARHMILRYVLATGLLLLAFAADWHAALWVVAGLLVPGAGAVAESLLLLGKMLHAPSRG